MPHNLIEIYKSDISLVKKEIKKGKKRISRLQAYLILELEKALVAKDKKNED